jgi:hypothetical protein
MSGLARTIKRAFGGEKKTPPDTNKTRALTPAEIENINKQIGMSGSTARGRRPIYPNTLLGGGAEYLGSARRAR